MHIIFIHTPMPHRTVPDRGRYWANFDERYYDFHPYARPLKKYLWELPHWVTWLGGVLYDQGFRSMEALDFYTDCGIVDGNSCGTFGISSKDYPSTLLLPGSRFKSQYWWSSFRTCSGSSIPPSLSSCGSSVGCSALATEAFFSELLFTFLDSALIGWCHV